MNGKSAGWLWGAALALLGAAFASAVAEAQTEESAPLFAGHDVIALTLTAPLRTLVARRSRRPDVTGMLAYARADGVAIELPVEVTTRGHSRLELCSFPPLRLEFEPADVEGTLFAGQDRLKLVTLCRETGDFANYLELEYLIYRMYAEVSRYAYKARPALLRYVDTDRDGRVVEAPAFFIEHVDGLAARVGMAAAEVPEIDRAALEPRSLAVLGLFQFMIGNTDWSVTSAADGEDCCHNSDVLSPAGGAGPFVVVPYDFDQAGLISASYALPNERLGIRSVRERLYRGFCRTNEQLDRTVADFNAARPAIESMLGAAKLDARFRQRAMSYVAEFYEIINDPEERQAQIVERCREG